MRRLIMVTLILAMVLGATISRGDWKVQVHRDGHVDEFIVPNVDSLTFWNDTTDAPVMVAVPAGRFIMGDGVAYCGQYEHEVTLTRDFYLSQHEVTSQEYMEALQWAYDHGHVTVTISAVTDNLDGSTQELLDLSNWLGEIGCYGGSFHLRQSPAPQAHGAYPDGYDPTDHPVKLVTWYGAARYCDWLSLQAGLPRAYEHNGDWSCNGGDPYDAEGFRLPTDAEWEYAAQYNDERHYPWGNEVPDCDRANSRIGGYVCIGFTTPAGSYPAAPSGLDLYDMAGNMMEWCNDWHVCYLGTYPSIDPTGPMTGTCRVLRGGSWFDHDAALRCAYRFCDSPEGSESYLGFRVARSAR